jgi:hypothetical protein
MCLVQECIKFVVIAFNIVFVVSNSSNASFSVKTSRKKIRPNNNLIYNANVIDFLQLVGAALIAVGTLYQVNFTDITKAIPEAYGHLSLIPILTIVVGSIIFIISFLGCCGAIKNSPCLLTTVSAPTHNLPSLVLNQTFPVRCYSSCHFHCANRVGSLRLFGNQKRIRFGEERQHNYR